MGEAWTGLIWFSIGKVAGCRDCVNKTGIS